MKNFLKYLNESSIKQKLEWLFFTFSLLLTSKYFFPVNQSFIITLITELIALLTLFFAFSIINEKLSSKSEKPLSLVLNIGISVSALFFLFSLSEYFSEELESLKNIPASLYVTFSIFLSVFIILLLLFILASLQYFFLLRQKDSSLKYFNWMLVLFALLAISESLTQDSSSIGFVNGMFFGISLLFVVGNSFRLAWIPFLSKRNKIFVLLLSFFIAGIFGLNFFFYQQQNHQQVFALSVLFNFSPSFRGLFPIIMLYGNIYFSIVFLTTLFHIPTSIAFTQKSDEVASLINIGNLLTQSFDIEELTDNLTSVTNNICNSDSSWIFIYEEEKLNLISVNNIDYTEADIISQELFSEIDTASGKSFSFENRIFKVNIKGIEKTFSFRSIILLPLIIHSHTNGFLFAVKRQKYIFEEDEKKALGALADNAAIAIENVRLLKTSIEKERMENELEVARTIQSKLLPDSFPQNENLEIDALFVPTFEVGGDYYDLFEIEKNKIAFIIADVSGKGVEASYIMAETKGIIGALSKVIDNPKELLIKTNDLLYKSLNKRSFVTALYGIMNTDSGVVNFVRAGHMPLLVCSNNILKKYSPNGIGLGINNSKLFDTTLENMEIKLNNNDILILHTDGITESKNISGEDFGYERFKSVIEKFCNSQLDVLTKNIFQSVSLFAENNRQHDDITLVIMKWKSNK